MATALLMFLLISALVLAICPSDPPVALEIEAQTTDKVGKLHRRADVLIFIPMRKEELVSIDVPLDLKLSSTKIKENLFRIELKIRNLSVETVEEARIEQPVKGKFSLHDIRAKKVISRKPYIFEFVDLYPTDIKEGSVVINLPSLRPSEELEVSYKLETESEFLKPKVLGGMKKEIKETKEVYILVGKYSLLFDYGKTATEDINVENVSYVIDNLKAMKIKPVVKIVGVADGKSTSDTKNRRVAKERALFVAEKILGSEFACYLNSLYASRD